MQSNMSWARGAELVTWFSAQKVGLGILLCLVFSFIQGVTVQGRRATAARRRLIPCLAGSRPCYRRSASTTDTGAF